MISSQQCGARSDTEMSIEPAFLGVLTYGGTCIKHQILLRSTGVFEMPEQPQSLGSEIEILEQCFLLELWHCLLCFLLAVSLLCGLSTSQMPHFEIPSFKDFSLVKINRHCHRVN